MKLNPDIINSLNQNLIEIGDGWAWFSSDVYSPGYREILEQPLSMGATTLDFISVKDLTTEITIRSGYTSASPLIYNGMSFNVNEFDDVNFSSTTVQNHNDLNNIQGGSLTERYHLSANTYNFLQTVSADIQTQINTLKQMSVSGMGSGTINKIIKFITTSSVGDSTISDTGTLVQIANNVSASGNISAKSFIKNGGTSTQFLKADGSVDSNTYAFQSFVNVNYLPLSGGNVYGRLYLGNSSNNGYLDLKTNGTSAGQTDINYRGGTSANRRMTIRYDEIKDAIEIFSSNDDGSARTNIQIMYRNQNTPSRYYTGLDIFSGNLSVQSLSASKLVATDASKNLISYTLTSADIPNLSNIYYPVSSTGNISGLTSPAQTQLNNLSANYTTRTEVSGISANIRNSLSAYLPLSGGTLTGNLSATQTISITKGLGTTISAATRLELMNNNFTWGAAPWMDSGGNMRIAYLQGDGFWTDRYILNRSGVLSAFGNITAPQFNGNLNGYKNVEGGNETTISNGYSSSGQLYINYRGATSAINEYRFWNGFAGSGGYSSIVANSFIKNGGTSAQFLKADGSSDSNVYTTTATTSSVSATLQSQITNNNNKLSAYLPLSGGTLTGQLLVKSNVSASGDLIGSRHIIPGGLSTQFLKADGSVDSNSYALDTLGSYYLPLSGGTLNGDMATQYVRPVAPFSFDLGSVFFPYSSLFVSAINANKINMEGSIIPINSISYDLGSDAYKWNKIYAKDFTSVAMSTTFDRNVEAVDVKSHILLGFNNQLAPHLNFSSSLGTSANLSGDFYFDGNYLKIRDKNLVLNTLAYTSNLSAYTPTSGLNQTISAYLPLSGGTLTGQLRGTTISASGNVSGSNFVGVLDGSTKIQRGNEVNLVDNFANSNGLVYLNYRGATSAITEYFLWNGKGSGGSGGAYSNIRANAFVKNGGTSTQFLKADGSSDSNVYITSALNSYLAFNNGGNNVYRGISGDIGSSESWEFAGKASTTGAGDVRINLYTSAVSQMVPFYIIQYSGGTPQNSITLIDASGKSGFNDISTNKITNNVIGNVGYVQDQTQISDTGISANNFVTNSSIIMQNAGRTADKIKIYDNLIQMRSGVSDPFVQLSASYNGTSGVFLNVSTANPSYPAILTSEIALLTSGFGIRGKTTYLKGDAPIIYTSAASTTKIEQLCQIMHDMGFIRYI